MDKHCALLGTLLGVLLTISCGKADTLLIAVTINGVSDDVEFVEVAPTLNGVLQKTEQFRGASRSFFALELPADTKGTFDLAVRGQLPIQCAIAIGAASVNLDQGGLTSFHDGRPYYPVQIDLTRLDGPQCSLSVQKTGTGKGTVYSLPRPGGPVECGKTCSADFPLGSVPLSAVAEPDSYFLGWEGVCSGTETTCTVQLPIQQPIVAHFAPKICTADSGTRWCWDNPLPQGNHLKAVQVSSDGKQVWAAGDHGTLLHLVNGEWLPVRLGTSANLSGLSMCANGQMLVAGTDDSTLKPVLFEGTSTGAGFSQRTLSPIMAGADLRSVWGCGGTDGSVAVAVGNLFIYRRTKSGTLGTWSEDNVGSTLNQGLLSVSGVGTEAWAVGENGLAVHGVNLDAATASWSKVVWGSLNPTPSGSLRSVWVASPSEVWIVGYTGAGAPEVLHLSQGTWKRETLPNSANALLYAVWGSGDEVWIAGTTGLIWHLQGGVWSQEKFGDSTIYGLSQGLAATPWIVGDAGLLASRTSGVWHPSSRGEVRNLLGLYVDTGVAYAVGNNLALRWDGTSWSKLSNLPANTVLNTIWGIGGQLYLGVADNSIWRLSVTDPQAPQWKIVDTITASGTGTRALWGASASDLWAVGPNEYLRHFDGQTWSKQQLGGVLALEGIWGGGSQLWAVGKQSATQSAVMTSMGTTWSTDSGAPSVGPLNAVWASSGDVWAVGKTHSVVRRQGATWSDWSSATEIAKAQDLFAVWGTGAGTVFLAGAAGFMLRSDGTQVSGLKFEETGAAQTFYKIAGTSDGSSIWTVGTKGAILRRMP